MTRVEDTKTLFRVFAFLFWANSGGLAWTVLQTDVLDDLYIQARQTETPYEIDVNLAKDVCRTVVPTDHFQEIIDSFDWDQTKIRSKKLPQITAKVEIPICDFIDDIPHDGYGYQTCLLTTEVADFKLALSVCGKLGATITFYLSHGYENDSLFFIFVHDEKKREMALLAYAEKIAIPFFSQPQSDPNAIESRYLQRRNSYYYELFKYYPELRNQNDIDVDPVCNLDLIDKVRLCNLLLDTPFYKNKGYIFPVVRGAVDEECSEVIVKMETTSKKADYTYACGATYAKNPSQLIPIHVARGYRNHEVFTFQAVGINHEDVHIVELENNFQQVSFIVEPYIRKIARKMEQMKHGVAGDPGYAASHNSHHASQNHNEGSALEAAAVASFVGYGLDGGADGGADGGGKK